MRTDDLETRQLLIKIIGWARQLASVQVDPHDMTREIDRLVERLDLDRADVHRLRPFRIVEPTEDTPDER